jgi:hypothetical protein
LLVVAVLISGCVGGKSTQLMESYSKANAKDAALDFIQKHPYYMGGGVRAFCDDAKIGLDGEYMVSCGFREDVNGTMLNHDVAIIIRGAISHQLKWMGL